MNLFFSFFYNYLYKTNEALECERFQDLFDKSLCVCDYRMVKKVD